MRPQVLCRCGRPATTSPAGHFQPLCLVCARGEMHTTEQVCRTLTRREHEARRNTRLAVLAALGVVGLIYAQCALQPRPSRAWMGDTLRHRVVMAKIGGKK